MYVFNMFNSVLPVFINYYVNLYVLFEKNVKSILYCYKSWTKILNYANIALWATRMTEETKDNRELHIKTTLRELIVYIVFLVILCIGKLQCRKKIYPQCYVCNCDNTFAAV